VPAADAHSIRPSHGANAAIPGTATATVVVAAAPTVRRAVTAKNINRRAKEQTRSDSEWCPSCRNFGGPAELTVRHGKNFA